MNEIEHAVVSQAIAYTLSPAPAPRLSTAHTPRRERKLKMMCHEGPFREKKEEIFRRVPKFCQNFSKQIFDTTSVVSQSPQHTTETWGGGAKEEEKEEVRRRTPSAAASL